MQNGNGSPTLSGKPYLQSSASRRKEEKMARLGKTRRIAPGMTLTRILNRSGFEEGVLLDEKYGSRRVRGRSFRKLWAIGY